VYSAVFHLSELIGQDAKLIGASSLLCQLLHFVLIRFTTSQIAALRVNLSRSVFDILLLNVVVLELLALEQDWLIFDGLFWFSCHLLAGSGGHGRLSTRWFWRHGEVMLVVIVTLEQFLDGVSSELAFALLDGVCILPFLIIHMVLVKIIGVDIWNKLGGHLSRSKRIPVEVVEPGMRLKLTGAVVVPNSILRFSLKALIDEVSCLDRPTLWNFVALDLDLLAEDLFSDLSPASTDVWSAALHALVCDDTNGKVVSGESVILPTHHFWGHVAWSA